MALGDVDDPVMERSLIAFEVSSVSGAIPGAV